MTRPVRIRLALLAILAGAAGFAIWRYGLREPAPKPPEIALEGAHPEVRAAVEAALDEVTKNPRDPKAWGALSNSLLANNFTEASIAVLHTTRRLDPRNPTWPFLEGSACLMLSRPLEAVPRFAEALPLTLYPEQRAAVYFQQFQTFHELGRPEEAESAVNSLRGLEGNSPRWHYAKGLLDAAAGRRESAIDHLNLLVDHPCARRQSSALLASLVRGDETLSNRHRARVSELPLDQPWPNSFDNAVRDARVIRSDGMEKYQELQSSGRREEALEFLRDLAARTPGEQVCFQLGLSLMRAGQFEESEAAFNQSLQFNRNNMKARVLLGAVLMERGERLLAQSNREKALSMLREAVRQEAMVAENRADTALSHYVAGRALLLLSEFEPAKAEFRRAIELGPDLYEAHVALGERIAEEGDIATGLTHFENAARVAPNVPEVQKAIDKWKAKLKPIGK